MNPEFEKFGRKDTFPWNKNRKSSTEPGKARSFPTSTRYHKNGCSPDYFWERFPFSLRRSSSKAPSHCSHCPSPQTRSAFYFSMPTFDLIKVTTHMFTEFIVLIFSSLPILCNLLLTVCYL